MDKQKLYTFEDDLKYRLKDPEFKKLWDGFGKSYRIKVLAKNKRSPRLFHNLAMT